MGDEKKTGSGRSAEMPPSRLEWLDEIAWRGLTASQSGTIDVTEFFPPELVEAALLGLGPKGLNKFGVMAVGGGYDNAQRRRLALADAEKMDLVQSEDHAVLLHVAAPVNADIRSVLEGIGVPISEQGDIFIGEPNSDGVSEEAHVVLTYEGASVAANKLAGALGVEDDVIDLLVYWDGTTPPGKLLPGPAPSCRRRLETTRESGLLDSFWWRISCLPVHLRDAVDIPAMPNLMPWGLQKWMELEEPQASSSKAHQAVARSNVGSAAAAGASIGGLAAAFALGVMALRKRKPKRRLQPCSA